MASEVETPQMHAVQTPLLHHDTPRVPTADIAAALQQSIVVVEDKLAGEYGPQSLPIHLRRLVFILFVFTEIMTNFDSGALAVLIGEEGQLTAAFSLSQTEQGLLAGLVYLGHVLGSFVTCNLLHKYRAKYVLAFSMLLDTAASAGFAWLNVKTMLFVTKFIMGACTAPVVVYAPVWVDDFAPPERQTLWMSLVQGGVALGVMLGYCFAGFLQGNSDLSWRWSFYVQTCCLGAIAGVMLLVPGKLINQPVVQVLQPDPDDAAALYNATPTKTLPKETHHDPAPGDATPLRDFDTALANDSDDDADAATGPPAPTGEAAGADEAPLKAPVSQARSNPGSVRRTQYERPPSLGLQAWNVAKNPLYLSTTLALTSLYFVVTGLQLWVTSYLKEGPIQEKNLNIIVVAFGFTSATGPILGVIAGGVALDRMGGYDSIARAARVCAVMGVAAAVCGYASIVATNFWAFIVCVWFLLFFGGAVVPPSTGLLISVVDPAEKHTAQGMAVATYNLLGYYAAPQLCGIVADKASITWGMRLVLGWSVIAMLFILLTYFLAGRMEKKAAAVLAGDEEKQPLTGGKAPADAPGGVPPACAYDGSGGGAAGLLPVAVTPSHSPSVVTAGGGRSFVGKSFSKNDWVSSILPAASFAVDTPRMQQADPVKVKLSSGLVRSFAGCPTTPELALWQSPTVATPARAQADATCEDDDALLANSSILRVDTTPSLVAAAPVPSGGVGADGDGLGQMLALSPRSQRQVVSLVKNSSVIFKVDAPGAH